MSLQSRHENKCVIQLRGVQSFIWDKYDLSWYSFYKETGGYNDGNKLDVQGFVRQSLKV